MTGADPERVLFRSDLVEVGVFACPPVHPRFFGVDALGIGDVTGDGVTDFLVTAAGISFTGATPGTAYVVAALDHGDDDDEGDDDDQGDDDDDQGEDDDD